MRTLLLLLTASVAMQGEPRRISWSESPQELAGEYVSVKLNTGTRIGGYWTAVTPTEFTMRVEKTSNRQAIARGVQTLPRTAIGEVSSRKRRVRGRVIGTIVGIYGGLTLLAALVSEGQHPTILLVPVAVGAGGYFLGSAIDHSTNPITFTEPRP